MGESLISSIVSNWMLDAKMEQTKYFFHYKEVSTILENKKCYVIGRKGSGKSAICNYIEKTNSYKVFPERLNFKNFPFNELYSLSNIKYTSPNQYITLWKYLIYSTVCRKMVENENIDSVVRSKLETIYPKNDIKQLPRRVSEWTSAEFGLNVLGNGGNLKASRNVVNNSASQSWIEKVNILEDIIINYCDDSKYYIVFDELDEDYREFENNDECIKYKSLLTSLFKAVQDVKSTFLEVPIYIMPIIFLRDDIYALLNDADKNKWSDLKLELDWTEEKIKKMLAYRISKDMDKSDILPFDKAWNSLFVSQDVSYGNKQNKKIHSFDFIARNTQMRPRDFIKYIKSCCETAKEWGEKVITPRVIKHVDREFSNYMRDEITDEIYPLIPEINNVFQVISNIRKEIFTFKEFKDEYDKYTSLGTISEKNIYFVLDTLFNFSVIGNEDRFRHERKYYKYLHTNMTYNIEEKIVLHRGLLKSLQIF